jgi:stage V sporulation protein D (sporulation-specific penicillin-binding protein)
MPMGRTDRRLRAVTLLLVFVVLATASVLKLGQVQFVAAPELQQRVQARLSSVREAPPVRGQITDRNGIVLAHTAWVDTLSASPESVPSSRVEPILDELSGILGFDEKRRAEIEGALTGSARYVVLARSLDAARSQAIRAGMAEGRLPGLALEPQQVRVYPNPGGAPGTTLASQLLGFVTADGRGRYGIEQRYDDILSGRGGMLASLSLPGGAGLPPADATAGEVEGQAVQLTLDAGLQLQLEKQLYHAWVLDKAERVSGVVLDPDTGEVLAWASVPGYDANDFASVWQRDPGLLADPIAAGVYEPGSVMKMFTAAAALSNGVFKPRSRLSDAGQLRLDGQTIRNADHKSMGGMRFEDVIAYSRNVATAKIALRLDRSLKRASVRLHRTWQAFGLGKPTGIDIAGEERGIVSDPRKRAWSQLDLANRSFGQGIATTQIQLAAAYAAMANGGYRVRPHFVLSDTEPASRRQRVLEPKVAGQLRRILHHVTSAVPWYADGSLIKGYEVGGKTGTAQIWDRRQGRYLPRTFNFSFVGYVGNEHPGAVVAVRIHHTRPKVLGQGILQLEISSYELFRRIALDVIRTLGIPRSKDPGAGYPKPRSHAERVLYPDRYQAGAGERSGAPKRAADTARASGKRGDRSARTRPSGARASRGEGVARDASQRRANKTGDALEPAADAGDDVSGT